MRGQQNGCIPTHLQLYMSKPIKALRSARDLYVKKLSCFGPICCTASVVPHHSCLQRGFGNSNPKPHRDRIRVKGGSKQPSSSAAPAGQSLAYEAADHVGIRRYNCYGLRRSNSYGLGYLGRIDEDKPYCFQEDFMEFRSRSVGIAMMTNLGFFDL